MGVPRAIFADHFIRRLRALLLENRFGLCQKLCRFSGIDVIPQRRAEFCGGAGRIAPSEINQPSIEIHRSVTGLEPCQLVELRQRALQVPDLAESDCPIVPRDEQIGTQAQ